MDPNSLVVDYKVAHLQWIKAHKDFIPSDCLKDDTCGGYDPSNYLEIMTFIYNNPLCSQDLAQKMYIKDVKWRNSTKEIISNINKSFHVVSDREWFVTFNFHEPSFSKSSLEKLFSKLNEKDWIFSYKAIVEYNTAKGNHPHIHFYMIIDAKFTKSKLLEKLWAISGIKKMMLSKNFIDIETGMSYHKDYVLGEKQESKQEYLEKDIEWRKSLGLKDLYTK